MASRGEKDLVTKKQNKSRLLSEFSQRRKLHMWIIDVTVAVDCSVDFFRNAEKIQKQRKKKIVYSREGRIRGWFFTEVNSDILRGKGGKGVEFEPKRFVVLNFGIS